MVCQLTRLNVDAVGCFFCILTVCCLVQIRVVKDNEGTVAPQLQCNFLESFCAQFCHDLSDSSLNESVSSWVVSGGYKQTEPTEPVKVTFLTRGCRQMASLTAGVFSRLVVKMFNTPFGKPALSARTAIVSTESGVSGEGLMTKQQPAAKAAPAFRATILYVHSQHMHTHSSSEEISHLRDWKVPGYQCRHNPNRLFDGENLLARYRRVKNGPLYSGRFPREPIGGFDGIVKFAQRLC